jgi:hypothetical protein
MNRRHHGVSGYQYLQYYQRSAVGSSGMKRIQQRPRPPCWCTQKYIKLLTLSRGCANTRLHAATLRLALLALPSELLKRLGDLFLGLVPILLHYQIL